MTPDDPTWAKLMRLGLDGGTGSFTTSVLRSTDLRGRTFRYVPVTTDPPRPNWVNRSSPSTCIGACHEMPSSLVNFIPGTMPPTTCTIDTCSAF